MGASTTGGAVCRKTLLAGALSAGLVGSAIPVLAQQQPFHEFNACRGSISSLLPGEIPAGNTYAIDILDPTEAALKFRGIFLDELKAAGKPTADDGNLVFSFRAESIFSGITPRTRVEPTYHSEDTGSHAPMRSDEDETRALIHSDRRGRGEIGSASQQIVVEAQLRNKQTQRVLWLATVHCDPITSDDALLMKSIAQIIVATLGEAVKQKPF